MELWFIFALLSALFAGIAAFLQKVAVEKGYDNMLFNTVGIVASVIPAYILSFSGPVGDNWALALTLATGGGVLYILSTFARTAAMQNMDTAIFFPLYKTFGPLVMTVFGVVLFKEWFTGLELLGIIMGIFIPLLLIHKSENIRQKNLKRGLLLMMVTVLLTSLSTITSKLGSDAMSNIFLFSAVANSIGGVAGLILFLGRQRNSEKHIIVSESLRDTRFMLYAISFGLMNMAAFITILMAFREGSIAIVFTINSLYILIPIILSIIIYKEHWNARKAFAIGLSIVALAFLG